MMAGISILVVAVSPALAQLEVGSTRERLEGVTRHLDGVRPGEETGFTDKMASGWWTGPLDCLTLKSGQNRLSVGFNRTMPATDRGSPPFTCPAIPPTARPDTVDFRK